MAPKQIRVISVLDKVCDHIKMNEFSTNISGKIDKMRDINRQKQEYARRQSRYNKVHMINKVGCVFPMIIVPMLPRAEFRLNDHREDTQHFIIHFVKYLSLLLKNSFILYFSQLWKLVGQLMV